MTSIYHFDPIEMNASMGPLGDSREGQSEGQGSGYASQEEFETIPPISIQEVLLEAKQLPYSLIWETQMKRGSYTYPPAKRMRPL
jgi:hypothetical protein